MPLIGSVIQRSPRVRYGRVHLFNNLYTATAGADYPYGYSIGVGFRSRIIAEHNAFELPAGARPFKWWKGERIQAMGNRLGGGHEEQIDAAAQIEVQAKTAISRDAGWQVPYRYGLIAVGEVAARVRGLAGAGR